MTKKVNWNPADPSRLFYQTRQRRPLLDRAEGVYMWDRNGKRYLDGSSGAMVSNIGHSNPRVLDAMRAELLTKDWSAITLSDIARTAGVSRQSIYNEFGSRQGLAQGYALRLADRLVDAVGGAIGGINQKLAAVSVPAVDAPPAAAAPGAGSRG